MVLWHTIDIGTHILVIRKSCQLPRVSNTSSLIARVTSAHFAGQVDPMASEKYETIAVVGMSCRFPGGANNPEKLWSLISKGKSTWRDVPAEKFNWRSFYHPSPDISGTITYRSGHFLDQDISTFDAVFFGIPHSEGHGIDPQQRIQLLVLRHIRTMRVTCNAQGGSYHVISLLSSL